MRGEDSLVRALWARRPFLWNIYPQEDLAHHAKLNAFLDWLNASAYTRQLHHLCNGIALRETLTTTTWQSALHDWMQTSEHAFKRLEAQTDLCEQLIAFAQHPQHRANA